MKITEQLPPWPVFATDERAAVDAVLASGKVNYWTGQECRLFEKEYADYLGLRHAIAVANGTVALELPLRAWGIGAGDEVIVTPRTFLASISCAVLLGARPVFADVDRDSGNVTAQTIERVMTDRTRAIIPVHLGGWPCEMDAILELANARGVKVLEDCAQAHGALYRNRPVGSHGHAVAFSFCQDKIITTGGEGGLIATNDARLWDWCWSFKDHGKTWEAVYERQHAVGFRWVHDRFGTNGRLTEMQAAIARLQLAKLPHWHQARRDNATIYAQRLGKIGALRIPDVPVHIQHAYYKFYVYLRPERIRPDWPRERIISAVTERGAPCFSGSCSEVYLERAFEGTGWAPAERLPVARELGETSLMFLVHPTLRATHVHRICDAVEEALREASV